MKYQPVNISEFSDTALSIRWSDGHESVYLYEDLRSECPCATCRKLRSSSKSGKLPIKKAIPLGTKSVNIKPVAIDPVGRYALQFKWNDRHETGIYTFDFLRDLCTCEACSS